MIIPWSAGNRHMHMGSCLCVTWKPPFCPLSSLVASPPLPLPSPSSSSSPSIGLRPTSPRAAPVLPLPSRRRAKETDGSDHGAMDCGQHTRAMVNVILREMLAWSFTPTHCISSIPKQTQMHKRIRNTPAMDNRLGSATGGPLGGRRGVGRAHSS